MRYLPLFILAGLCAPAQDFLNGQAARIVIGQPTFTEQKPQPASQYVLGGVGGLAYANNTLYVADANRAGASPNNNRVLAYQDLSSLIPEKDAAFPQGTRCPACVGPATMVLGQPDFGTTEIGRSTGMRLPTAVATDGTMLAVADTDNNRVLLWRSIPTATNQLPDVVLGQKDMATLKPATVDAQSLRGPQGVWFQNGKFFVADTMNHRVLIWNSIPSQNEQPADIVLGQANFNVAEQPSTDPDPDRQTYNAQSNTLLNPVSATSDGIRLYVSDLGHNRVLIWNSIPTQNQQAADVVLGQPDFTAARANNVIRMCSPTGNDEDGNPRYPGRCASTMDFPRFALSDGQRLFVADGGNDRVMIYKNIPTTNGAPCDIVLGQLNAELNNNSDSANPDAVAAADALRGPISLAWDNTNLYVSDSYNRRIMVFTPALDKVPYTGVRNSASYEVFAVGSVTIGLVEGQESVKADEEVTITIEEKEYKYKAVENDTVAIIVANLISLINDGAGDPNVIATPNPGTSQVQLTSRLAGPAGNEITYSAAVSEGATTIATTTAGSTLLGGQDAAKIAGGTVVTIVGEGLSDVTAAAPADADPLPLELGNVQVFMDGIQSPLYFVSPTQINAQLPWEVRDSLSVSAMVRVTRQNGTVETSSAIAVPVIPQNPGIYAREGVDPRPGIVMHGSSFATGMIQIDGSITPEDVATITIRDRAYSYSVIEGDTTTSIRDGLIRAINANGGDPEVSASAAGVFVRVLLTARRPGPDMNGLPFSVSVSDAATVILSPSNTQLCCANIEGALVTAENPAIPGERIKVVATGLGPVLPQEAQDAARTGYRYNGPADNYPVEFVSSLAGGKTANVIYARMQQGQVGLYEVMLELNADMPTNLETQLTIAQSFQVSNIVRFPLKNPADDTPAGPVETTATSTQTPSAARAASTSAPANRARSSRR